MKFDPRVEQWRDRQSPGFGSPPGADYGRFFIPSPKSGTFCVIASSGDEELGVAWEHVSVSLTNRTPNWTEMCFIKDLFWAPEDAVMQLHPPRSQHINVHPYCLHLWRPLKALIPLPPRIAV
jgi:hypothetical protein